MGCTAGKDSGSDPTLSERDEACAALAGSEVSEGLDAGLFALHGETVDSLAAFEAIIQNYMWTYGIPNAGLAFVAGDKRLVMSRSYDNHCGGEVDGRGGWVHEPETSQPDSQFRVASISKVITATAVIAASEGSEPLLALDDPLVNFVPMVPRADFDGDGRVDTRSSWLDDITINHLLRHRAGWNCDKADDPDFVDAPTKSDFNIQAAYARVGVDVSLPITISDIIGYGSGLPFAYEPGSKKNYCGFGFLLLGEVLAAATGTTPESAVQEWVFSKLGSHSFEQGRTLQTNRSPGELIYHHHTHARTSSVMSRDGSALYPYGGAFNLENRFATGGWVASPVDLVRLGWEFVHGNLVSDPARVVGRNMGWGKNIRRDGATGHTGSLEGSHSILLCYADSDPDPVAAGACWTVLFNRSPPRETDEGIEPRDVLLDALVEAPLGLTDLGTTENYW